VNSADPATSARPTDERLLTQLLDAVGEFVPGQKLQAVLGVSRPAIYQCVERLASQGIVIEARRHYGYRLVEEPVVFSEVLLRAYRPLILGCPPIHFFDTVDSTNTIAERLLAVEVVTPFVVVGREQTAGRGRRGRVWHSPDAGNLYASFAFRPQRPPREMPPITLWLGIAVARLLRDRLSLPVMVKWPNDLLLHGRKLAGMLTEARIDADSLRDLVYGLGLNLRADTRSWPEEVRAVLGRDSSVGRAED
jgi:BirA family transcriptional regulator, biotin operon repressor / biotin---[acetyl-CoA-carboxylase] ligase